MTPLLSLRFLEVPADSPQHRDEHRLGQFSCERILLARMVRREKPRQFTGQLVARSVREGKSRKALNFAAVLQQPEIRSHRNAPQHEHGARPQNFQLSFEIRAAILKLRRQRLIGRWRATHRRRDVGAVQSQPVAGLRRCRLVRESRSIKRPIKKVSGAIPGENSARAIPAVCRGRQTQNQKPRVRIAESGNRLAPVFALAKCAPFLSRYFLAEPHQPRAFSTRDNFLIQRFERIHSSSAKKLSRNPFPSISSRLEPARFSPTDLLAVFSNSTTIVLSGEPSEASPHG
jgi:hypothetical protein